MLNTQADPLQTGIGLDEVIRSAVTTATTHDALGRSEQWAPFNASNYLASAASKFVATHLDETTAMIAGTLRSTKSGWSSGASGWFSGTCFLRVRAEAAWAPATSSAVPGEPTGPDSPGEALMSTDAQAYTGVLSIAFYPQIVDCERNSSQPVGQITLKFAPSDSFLPSSPTYQGYEVRVIPSIAPLTTDLSHTKMSKALNAWEFRLKSRIAMPQVVAFCEDHHVDPLIVTRTIRQTLWKFAPYMLETAGQAADEGVRPEVRSSGEVSHEETRSTTFPVRACIKFGPKPHFTSSVTLSFDLLVQDKGGMYEWSTVASTEKLIRDEVPSRANTSTRMRQKCGTCQQEGHNRSTCPRGASGGGRRPADYEVNAELDCDGNEDDAEI